MSYGFDNANIHDILADFSNLTLCVTIIIMANFATIEQIERHGINLIYCENVLNLGVDSARLRVSHSNHLKWLQYETIGYRQKLSNTVVSQENIT